MRTVNWEWETAKKKLKRPRNPPDPIRYLESAEQAERGRQASGVGQEQTARASIILRARGGLRERAACARASEGLSPKIIGKLTGLQNWQRCLSNTMNKSTNIANMRIPINQTPIITRSDIYGVANLLTHNQICWDYFQQTSRICASPYLNLNYHS